MYEKEVMPRKEPLYFKKSKAAKQFEIEDDFYPESESYLRQVEREPGRNKLKTQNGKEQHKYKRIDNFSYYDDQYNERKGHNYDADIYLETDYTYDSGDYDYITEGSDYSDTELSLDRSHRKSKKKRQRTPSKKSEYNHKTKHKENHNNFRKHKNPTLNSNEHRIMRDEKDFNVYISQQPITFPYKSQDDHKEPLESITQRKPKSKEHKALKIPTSDTKPPGNYQIYMTELRTTPSNTAFGKQQQGDSPQMHSALIDFPNIDSKSILKEITTNISQNSAQSTLRLVYVPFFVANNSKNSLSAEITQPALLANNTDVVNSKRPLQNTMTVLAALNTDNNNIFEQQNKSTNKEKENSILNRKSNENIRKSKSTGVHKKEAEKVKKKLCASNLGAAMTAESYASLIVSHPEHKPAAGGPLSLVKLTKTLKKKKGSSSNSTVGLQHDDAENDQYKTLSTAVPANGSKGMSDVDDDPYPTEEKHQATSKYDDRKENDRELSSISKESVLRGINNNNKTVKEEKKSSHMRSTHLGQLGEDQNVVINIKEHSFISNVLPTATQTNEKETNLNSRVTGRQSAFSNVLPTATQTNERETNLNSRVTGRQSAFSIVLPTATQTNERETNFNSRVTGRQSAFSNVLPTATQTNERETYLNSRVTGRQSVLSRKQELADMKGKESRIGMKGKQSIVDYRYSQQNQSTVDRKISLGPKNCSTSSEVMTGNYKKVGPNQNSINTLRTSAIADGERSFVMGPTSDNSKNSNEFKNMNSKTKTDSTNKPVDMAKVEERKMSLAKQRKDQITIDDQSNFVAHDKGFSGEISLNELEEKTNIQNGEEKEMLNNPKSILRKEMLKKAREIKEENEQKLQQENENSEINNELEIQTDSNVQSDREDTFSMVSSKGKPSIKVIHAPKENKNSMVQSTNSNLGLCLQSEEQGELSHHNPSNLLGYTKAFLLVYFQTAQYILGVSCFDKLIHVIDFLSYEDDI